MLEALTKLFGGTKSERDIKSFSPIIDEVNGFFAEYKAKPQDDLIAGLAAIREEIKTASAEAAANADDTKEGDDLVYETEQAVLDDRMEEVFGIVKAACHQLLGNEFRMLGQTMTWDMVPFDVQVLGAIVLHNGRIAEMKTGEGKTLVATMPLVLNALTGRGAHLITVNDYLAQRDSVWMGQIYKYLGMSIGCILNSMTPSERREMYGSDITYGTNNEFGFDYLRDNMAIAPEDQVQRDHAYVIVDEVDSVLIDEARTPLIISGQVDAPKDSMYTDLRPQVEKLIREQKSMVNKLVAEAEALWEEKDYEAGTKLLIASRGMPKNRALAKMYQQTGVQVKVRNVETDYMRDKKLHELDEELYFYIDEKSHIIDLTDKGREAVSPNDPEAFIIPDVGEAFHIIEQDDSLDEAAKLRAKEDVQTLRAERSNTIHHISQLLRAYSLYEKDVDYVVQDDKVLIVDEFTGRILAGRRYSDGLHQALESKEKVSIEKESQTVATITIQNYFRMYEKLAGMTGTAETEAQEFSQIYKLEVTSIPTNVPVIRNDIEDQVYKTTREKYNAILNEIELRYRKGQPCLVGTITVEVSETLARMLKRRGIPHNVLNAKHHQSEAEIVQRAGHKSAVTIATNMAGRGTDIKLTDEVRGLGGLHIIGTERHESRRIDLQLRGRAGRQGDNGSSVFFLSLEDDLMRLFQSDRIIRLMDRMGVEDGEVITHSMVSKSIARAQKRVETRNFGIRKHLLEYDDVMNQQREIIYDRRNHALHGDEMVTEIGKMTEEFVEGLINLAMSENDGIINNDAINRELESSLLTRFDLTDVAVNDPEELQSIIHAQAMDYYQLKRSLADQDAFANFERYVFIRTMDEKWQQHLYSMDQLREGINLRAYGQKNPLLEYKSEGFGMFVEMLDDINASVLRRLYGVRIAGLEDQQIRLQAISRQMRTTHADTSNMGFVTPPPQAQPAQQSLIPGVMPTPIGGAIPPQKQAPIRTDVKIGRNDPCYCGSGKKYKKCHGK